MSGLAMSEPVENTVGYYDRNAGRFEAETANVDMSEIHDRFLRYLPKKARLLEAGCGVGRDALAFAKRGLDVVAFDASTEMVRLTRERAGGSVEIHQMQFEDLAWEQEFDGIWTCASLLHVPKSSFPDVATRLANALRPGGAWYMSFKFGVGERLSRGRYFTDHTEETLRAALPTSRICLAEVWISTDYRSNRAGERWLNAIGVSPR